MARVMDVAYVWDGDIRHYGEALMLACLVKVKKIRKDRDEEYVKNILGVYDPTRPNPS